MLISLSPFIDEFEASLSSLSPIGSKVPAIAVILGLSG
jgi:hypothetical protein